ncbi:hypothetical protein H4R19_002467 [Coemansia spiralis]|nr:hypothetical protein H4R19_002467 [Coemansia spiralis]
MAHLYDPPSDSDTQDVSANQPYVPHFPPATVASVVDPQPAAVSPYTGLAQSAYEWGSDTLQTLRSFWDYQWADAEPADARAAEPAREQESVLTDTDTGSRPASSSSSASYRDLPGSGRHGPQPASTAARRELPPTHTNGALAGGGDGFGDLGTHRIASRARTEPVAIAQAERIVSDRRSLRSLALYANGRASLDDNVNRPGTRRRAHVKNRFDGRRSRYRCNIIGDNYRRKCVWARAPMSTKLKVILRFATFNKAEGIRTIGRDVLAPRGLAGSYEDYVDYCKQEFAAVLRIFADPGAYPILFHCHHGKDRTGIVAMLLLGILGVDDQVIAADYAQSAKNLEPVRKRMELLDMGAVGLPPSFCDSPAPVMLSLLHHIRTNYGSVRGYLRSAGLTTQEIGAIAWCLRGNFYSLVHAGSRRTVARGAAGAPRPDGPPEPDPEQQRFY